MNGTPTTRFALVLFACAVFFPVASLNAATMVLVDEDFESYTDTADLGGTWSLGDGTLDTANGNPGQSLNHPGTGGSFSGGNTNSLGFPGVYPGPGQTLIFQADIYDDANSNNERNSAGLRTASGANIIEMGHYNNPTHYAIRTVLFGAGSDGSWVAFSNLVDDSGTPIENIPVEGWHTYTAEITNSQVTFTLDLNGDGNINATHVANITQNAAFQFNQVRLGGPSDLNSTAGGVKFDNVSVTLVPEPSTLVLLGLAAVGMIALRR